MTAHPKDLLSAYLDGELAAGERQAVELHLRDCDPCALALEDLAALDELARHTPVEAPARYFEELAARLGQRLREETQHLRRPAVAPAPARARLRAWPTWAYAAAATLLVASVAPFLVRHARHPLGSDAPLAAPSPPPSAVPGTQPVVPASAAPPGVAVAPPLAAPQASPRKAPVERAVPAPARLAAPDSGPPARLAAREAATAAPEEEGPRAAVSAASAVPPAPPSTQPDPAAQDHAAGEAPASASAGAVAAAPAMPPAESRPDANAAAPVATVVPAPRAAVLRKASPADRSAADFAKLQAHSAETAAAIRELRAAYRSFISENAGSPSAGEAWIRVVELGVRLARLTGDAADWEQARSDAATARGVWRQNPGKTARLLELLAEAPKKE